LYVTGSPGAIRTVFVPSGQSKTYIVYNGVSGGYSINVYAVGQTSGVTIPNGATILMYTDGTNCFLVSPTTAANPTIGILTGYVNGTQLNVTSGSVVIGQVIYNPGFITSGNPNGYATVSSGTSTPYALTYPGTSVLIGDATYAPNQPFVVITTPTQLVTLDYVQNKTQSIYLGGTPTTSTANASVFEGYIAGTKLIVTNIYPGSNGAAIGQYINGTNITTGSYIQSYGTGSTASSVFTGYISSGAGSTTAGTTLTVTGISSGTLVIGQYIDGGSTTSGTTIASGSGLSWVISGSSQSIGTPTNPVTFRGFGAGTGTTGWYTLNTASTGVTITPIVAFYQPNQLANMTLFSYVSYLVGSIGSQDYNNVNITGGTISGTSISINGGGTGLTSITPNAVLTGGSTSTSAVVPVVPGAIGNTLTSTAGATVTSGSFVIGTQYSILTIGTTDFTLIGASANTVGVIFNATGVGTGTGTAALTTWTSAAPSNMTLLGTLNTTSGTTQTLSGLTLTNYKNLYITATNVAKTNDATSQTLWLGGVPVGTSIANLATGKGFGTLDLNSGVWIGAIDDTFANASLLVSATSYSTATTSIVFSWSSSGVFLT
jgi:hypothetical protein